MGSPTQKLIIVCIFLMTQTALTQVTNPRHPAEWEQVSTIVMEADLIMHYPTLWTEAIDPFIKVAQVCIDEGVHFYMVDPDTGSNYATKFVNMDTVFSNRGLTSPFIHILHVNHSIDNFPWARDNGPYTIYGNKVGNTYLGGYDDDIGASYFAGILGKTFINLPKVNSTVYYYDGGNWLTDGHGTFNICNTHASGFSNGLVQPPILPFSDYLGIARTLNVTGVDIHADYWIKLINEETFIVGYLPPENYIHDPMGYRNSQAYIDSGINAIRANLQSAFGRSFKFCPIQNAPSFNDIKINTTYLTEQASYTNSLIINKTVMVPQYDSSPYDSIALSIYRQLMPGYRILGADCRSYAAAGGALHCITREIYADNPIYIKHAWLPDSLNQVTDYQIDATVMSVDNIASVKLFWTTNVSSGFDSSFMTNTGNHNYRAFIPGQAYGTTISYFLKATNNNGKTISKPMVAPEGYFKTLIDPDGVTSIGYELASGNVPGEYSLSQNYPNPFNPSTTIRFKLPNVGTQHVVSLRVYNLLGREVATLVNEKKPAGIYQVQWNAATMPSGIYFYRLQAGQFNETKKLILLK